ncbi:MAG TPA: DUF1223 domain-containing protein [Devosia sp.]|nr:DUF1223 domain-containing protein [Devosia sp.]
MQTITCLIAATAAALAAGPAAAAEVRDHPRAVLELFTSQGCSSCPSADARLGDLGKSPDLITLAYHVDYWDYIGWTDTFGAKANSDLQRSYAQSWGSSRIYTPELVINGRQGVVGSREKDVTDAMSQAGLDLPVELKLGDKMLEVTVGPRSDGASAMVWLVTFRDHAQVSIERGENAGRTMDYTQIVTGRQMLGMWDSANGTRLKLPLSELTANGANGAAILVQTDKDGLPGEILGAASVQL